MVPWEFPENFNKNKQRNIFADKVTELKAKHAVLFKLSKIDPEIYKSVLARHRLVLF